MESVTCPPQYRITWHVSPLDECPEVVEFDFWHELEDWISDKESECECFDLSLCHIETL
jgi:hypothetical protein